MYKGHFYYDLLHSSESLAKSRSSWRDTCVKCMWKLNWPFLSTGRRLRDVLGWPSATNTAHRQNQTLCWAPRVTSVAYWNLGLCNSFFPAQVYPYPGLETDWLWTGRSGTSLVWCNISVDAKAVSKASLLLKNRTLLLCSASTEESLDCCSVTSSLLLTLEYGVCLTAL